MTWRGSNGALTKATVMGSGRAAWPSWAQINIGRTKPNPTNSFCFLLWKFSLSLTLGLQNPTRWAIMFYEYFSISTPGPCSWGRAHRVHGWGNWEDKSTKIFGHVRVQTPAACVIGSRGSNLFPSKRFSETFVAVHPLIWPTIAHRHLLNAGPQQCFEKSQNLH